MKNYLIIIPLILLLSSCGGKKEKEESSENAKAKNKKGIKVNIKKELIGRWKNSNIKVTMKTQKGDSILTANNKNWQELLKIKPIVTTFKKDGTFKSVYKGLDGKVIMTSEGTWEVKKDSLYMSQDGKKTGYHVKIKDGNATFKSVLDWDNDGEMDDSYWGKQQKLIKKEDGGDETKADEEESAE